MVFKQARAAAETKAGKGADGSDDPAPACFDRKHYVPEKRDGEQREYDVRHVGERAFCCPFNNRGGLPRCHFADNRSVITAGLRLDERRSGDEQRQAEEGRSERSGESSPER